MPALAYVRRRWCATPPLRDRKEYHRVQLHPSRTVAPPRPGRPWRPAGPGGPLLYTPAENAARLQVRESWLRRKAAAQQVPCTFLGKHLRFSPTDLTAIITAAARPAVGRTRRPCDWAGNLAVDLVVVLA